MIEGLAVMIGRATAPPAQGMVGMGPEGGVGGTPTTSSSQLPGGEGMTDAATAKAGWSLANMLPSIFGGGESEGSGGGGGGGTHSSSSSSSTTTSFYPVGSSSSSTELDLNDDKFAQPAMPDFTSSSSSSSKRT